MNRRKRYIHSAIFQEKLTYNGEQNIPTEVTVRMYDAKSFGSKHYKPTDSISLHFLPDKVVWYQVKGFSNVDKVATLGAEIGIRFQDLQNIINSDYITNISSSEKYTIFNLNRFYYKEGNELGKERICILLKKGYVATFQEGNDSTFKGIENALKRNTLKIRERGADYLAYLLLHSVIDGYIELISGIDASLEEMEEEMEDQLIAMNDKTQDIGVSILSYKRSYGLLKRAIIPLRELMIRFIHANSGLVKPENDVHFADINDQLLFANQLLDSCKEQLSSLADLYLAHNDLHRNEIIKRLTVVSTIFIPLTFVAGLWGMNFENMPEIKWKYGYLLAWASFIIIIALSWLYLRKKKWL